MLHAWWITEKLGCSVEICLITETNCAQITWNQPSWQKPRRFRLTKLIFFYFLQFLYSIDMQIPGSKDETTMMYKHNKLKYGNVAPHYL